MLDATERLVNLALYLASVREAVPARLIREEVEGYLPDQDEEAFQRMFERDKKELRAAGLVIRTVDLFSGSAYQLDRDATFARPLDLEPGEAAVLRVVGASLIGDDSFPFRDALPTALVKLAASPLDIGPGAARIAEESSGEQGAIASSLAGASVSRKRTTFTYTDAQGRASSRGVHPYGIFLRDGRWYLVAFDLDAREVRVFAVRRMDHVEVDRSRPGTPDFKAADDFDIADFARLPFQYGSEDLEAVLLFEPDLAWRAPILSEGHGSLETLKDGSVSWTVTARDSRRLARWVVDNAPGIRLAGPTKATEALRHGLEEVIRIHG